MKQQWQTTVWINSDNPTSVLHYGDTQSALWGAVTKWLYAKQPLWVCTRPRKGNERIHATTLYYRDTPIFHGETAEDAQARPWNIELPSSRFLRLDYYNEGVAWFVKDLLPSTGPEFTNQLLGDDGKPALHLIQSHYSVEPNELNKYLARGWVVTSIDQHADEMGSRRTNYHLAHAELDAR